MAPAGSSPHLASVLQIRGVLFDLDGTLIDTAVEIAVALERSFAEFGIRPLSPDDVRGLIGRGIVPLVQRALNLRAAEAINAADVVTRFQAHYADTVGTAARPYEGVAAGFELLRTHGLALGVVTNKPRYFAERLLERFQLLRHLSCVVTGDEGLPNKPEKDMILVACARLASAPENTLMVGDSENDVIAARRAGCRVWCVPYGYNEGRPANTLDCDRLVADVLQAARFIVRSA